MSNSTIRYGVGLRKRYMAVSKEKKARYKCDVCGKTAVKRVSTGIWHCRYCNATFAGGAYSLKTAAGETVSMILNRRNEGR
jgi:large subunit ribosomal protein L37Ae